MPPHRSPEIVLLSRTLAVARLQVELARLHNARMFAWDDLRHNIDLATPYGLRMHRGMQQTPRASADFVASEIKSFRALVWGQNRHSGWMFASLTERGPLTVPLSRQSANFANPSTALHRELPSSYPSSPVKRVLFFHLGNSAKISKPALR